MPASELSLLRCRTEEHAPAANDWNPSSVFFAAGAAFEKQTVARQPGRSALSRKAAFRQAASTIR